MIGDWIDKVEYPQMPTMSGGELAAFLDKALFARLGTLNEEGSIHRLIRLLERLIPWT